MGVSNLNNGIDVDRARYNRENRLNPPEFAPGQDLNPVSTTDLFGNGGDLFSGGGSVFDNSPQEVNTSGMSDPFSPMGSSPFGDPFSPMGGSSMGMPMGGGFNTGNMYGPSQNGMIQNTQPQQGFTYEKAEELTKSTIGGLQSIGASLSKTTALFWYKYCGRVSITGFSLMAISLLFGIFKVGNPFVVLISGLILGVGGIGASLIVKDKTLNVTSEYKDTQVITEPSYNPVIQEDPLFDMGDESTFDFPNTTEPESMDFPDVKDPLDIDIDIDNIKVDIEPEPKEDPEVVLEQMQEIPQGMYTRKYLYDMFTKLLPNICPQFSVLREISEDDNAFYEMESAVQEAAEVTGCKETIELQKLQENYATVIVTTSRPTGLKLDVTAEELARIYAYRSSDISEDGRSRVYAKAEAIGRTCIFTIFTGKTAMISLKDMYKQCEDYVLDSKNHFPVVFGIDPMAKVIMYDLKKLESIIVAGMPRCGKSWFVQNMITQMAAFTSPKELQFYICDPKGEISDFKSFCLPHVKKFVTSDDNIMETLRWLVKVEAPRRKKIIGAGDNLTSSQNIWDFKERYPDVDLSIIYVVIDEVVTLASRMEKETFAEFKSMLRELISQLPALGIRAILIPHVLKNDIIEKKTSDLVLCRISVCGDPEHVESVTGAKPKDFPFKLTRPGDMAVRIPPVSQSIMYLRAPVLNPTNTENRELFDYMRRVWTKLEPESVKDSLAKEVEDARFVEESLATDIDDLDIFESNDKHSDIADAFLKRMNS